MVAPGSSSERRGSPFLYPESNALYLHPLPEMVFLVQGAFIMRMHRTTWRLSGVLLDGPACAANTPPTVNSPCSIVVAKYGDASDLGPTDIAGHSSWSFNATAEYSVSVRSTDR